MTPTELLDLVDSVRKNKAESNFLELKKAHLGSPKRLYDTLSSFSNQDGGGVILFGLDEDNDFEFQDWTMPSVLVFMREPDG